MIFSVSPKLQKSFSVSIKTDGSIFEEKYVKENLRIQTFRGDIHFLEWYGTRRHPRTTEKVLADVNIKRRGMFYYVSDDNGSCLLKKKIDSNGTWIDKKH